MKYPANEAANEINRITGCSMAQARRIVALIIAAATDPMVRKCRFCRSPFVRNGISDREDYCEHCGAVLGPKGSG